MTGPSGSPAAVSIDLGATNPSPGDQVSFTFNLPDGTTASVQLTASSANPPPAGSFTIGATPTATAGNLNTALNTAIGTLANTTLVAASAVEAGHDFFDPAGTATGSVVNNKLAAPITGATALSGGAGTDSISTNFAAGDTITVNGTPITFVASGATGNQLNVTDSVQTLLSKIDSITGTSTPSTISGGVITLHTDNAASLNVTSSNSAALGALGFGATVTAVQPPLRVSGSPLSSATSLVKGSANTVAWYTGNSSAGPAGIVDRPDRSVDYRAIRRAGQRVGDPVAAPGGRGIRRLHGVAYRSQFGRADLGTQRPHLDKPDAPARSADHLGYPDGFCRAQTMMQDASARQTQTQTMLQNIVDQTETVSTQQVASEILALQTALSASYQTTSMLSALTLTKFLPVGG